MEVNVEEQVARVHFNGWNASFDTWIPFSNLRPEAKKEFSPSPAPAHLALTVVRRDRVELSVVAGPETSKNDGAKELQQYQFRLDGKELPVQKFAPPLRPFSPSRHSLHDKSKHTGVQEDTWTCVLEDPFQHLEDSGTNSEVRAHLYWPHCSSLGPQSG